MSYIFETATVTHPGKIRRVNEDSLFADGKRGLWLVADGMGGHRDGGLASAMITDAARGLVAEGAPRSQLAARIQKVNSELLHLAEKNNGHIVGSTVTALMAEGNEFRCIWAGDSRCYRVRSGKIEQISHDHTEVQELLNSGTITAAEARTWPRRNVITRAVGADAHLELAQVGGHLAVGDCFVLCSDGLTGHVTDEEILGSLSWSHPQSACQKLLDLALERGGKDNISIIIISVFKSDKTHVINDIKG